MCNTGVRLTPLVDGRVVHLEFRGLYDGVSILSDAETGSIWHHITGESLYGPLQGRRLEPIGNVLHMTAGEAIRAYPEAQVAISDRPIAGRANALERMIGRIPILRDGFRRTMAPEDTRRPTMDVGLGVWTDEVARYYPLEAIGAAGNALVDTLDGRRVVIYYSESASAPGAFYTTATEAAWDGDTMRLGDGTAFRGGVLRDAGGARLALERPLQLFTRWYGYALTFPRTGVYAR